MRKIIEGVRSFQEHEFKENQDLFLVLAHGQSPRYLVITCSDSRVVPHLLTGLGPGEIFLAGEEGIFAGFSTNAHRAAAWRLLAEPEAGATIEFLACDSGLKYLSTDLSP